MKQSFESRMIVVWRKAKGRKDKTATGGIEPEKARNLELVLNVKKSHGYWPLLWTKR
jgi:hypothetical protein